MRKYLLVINPSSGGGRKALINQLKEFFQASGFDHDIIYTQKNYTADTLVRNEFSDSYSHLVIGGGDGTVYDAINGLPDFDRPVGVVPLGSGNDFCKYFDLGDDLTYLVSDKTVNADMGICNGKLFANGVGAGFDGQIVKNMVHGKGIFSGHAAYYYHVIRILGSYRDKKVEYEVDGQIFTENIILVLAANGTTFGGGFRLAPQASIYDGKLDLCVIHAMPGWKRFLKLNQLKNGEHLEMPEVSYLKFSELRISPSNVHGQIDGEYCGKPPFEIALSPNKLKVLVNNKP